MIPLVVLDPSGNLLWGASFSHVVLVLGVICGLVYFFFSVEHKVRSDTYPARESGC